MKVSNNPADAVVTYSLGSCIGLVIYDPIAKAGGILHYMLPESGIDKEKSHQKTVYVCRHRYPPPVLKRHNALGAKKTQD